MSLVSSKARSRIMYKTKDEEIRKWKLCSLLKTRRKQFP